MIPSRVAADYGTIHRDAALVAPPHDVVWVRGGDAVTFLEGLLSQRVETAPEGSVTPGLLLSPQGKLISPLWMLRGAAGVGLVADTGSGPAVLETLQRFRLRVDVSLEAEPGPTAEVWGPAAAAAVEAASGISPVPGAWREAGDSVVADLPFRHVTLPRWLIVGIESEKLMAAGAHPVAEAAAAAARIEAGEARMGIDLDAATIPQEAGLTDAAVDFTKGCYLGQELVARIESRGHVNRRLRGLRCAVGDTPPPGAALLVDGRRVGTLTSVAMSPEREGPVALGWVRREVDVGTVVEVGWSDGATTATVAEVPLGAKP